MATNPGDAAGKPDEQIDKLENSGFDWREFTPEDSPLTPMEVLADPRHQDLSTPALKVGDLAYNFSSPVYDFGDGTEVATGKAFDLLEVAKEKPVALIFGSYT